MLFRSRSVESARLVHEQSLRPAPLPEQSPDLRPSIAGASQDADVRRNALATLRRIRKVRSKYLPEELFSDPCWEMLLDLYDSRLSGEDVTVTGLGVVSGVPMSTALRRIQELQKHRLIERIDDRSDKRRQLVTLTPDGLKAIDNFFDGYLGHAAR